MHSLDLVRLLVAQNPVEPVNQLSEGLQKGGLAFMAALFICISALLYRAKEKKADACEAEVRALHLAHAKALQEVAEKSRANEEAKNAQLVSFTSKFVEVVSANTNAMERMTESIDRLLDKRGG